MINGASVSVGNPTARTKLKSSITTEFPLMKTHAPIHPGEVLQEDFLIPLGLSEYRVAKDIGVPPRRINEIVKGKRAVTADTALRLERYFGWPAEVWLNLQTHHDQQLTKETMKATLAAIQPYPFLKI